MTTSINDMIRAMRENPEARDALRREILTEELLTLPQRLADLVAVVTRQGQDIEALKEDMSILKEDVSVLKEDVRVLKNDVGYLKGRSLEATLQGSIVPF